MIENIRLDPKLDKCLAALKKGSRRAVLAADRVQAIIAELQEGKTPPGQICAFTHNGEARIKGCLKYDLNAGYRLVTMKRGSDLFLLFAGTHDDCDRWIENHRDQLALEPIVDRSRSLKRAIRRSKRHCEAPAAPDLNADDDWLQLPGDRELRQIFSGLIGESPADDAKPQ